MAVTVAATRETGAGHRLVLAVSAVALAAAFLVGAAYDAGAADSYPRLANIHFGSLAEADLEMLSRWDLLVLSKRAEDIHQAELAELRAFNPDARLIAHFPVAYGCGYTQPPINGDLSAALEANNWWMLDTEGERVQMNGNSFMLNMSLDCPTNAQGQRLCEWLPGYIAERLQEGGRWDGVFLDYCVDRIAWWDPYLDYPIDHDLDGNPAAAEELNESWRLGMRKCVTKLRDLVGDDFLLVANGNNTLYDWCDGDTREKFPNMHGDWYENMMNEEHGYLAFEALYRQPTTNIINYIWEGEITPDGPRRGGSFDREFLFGLTSTLVFGGGYFSCDDTAHAEVWWIEYYDVDLGQPLGRAEDVQAYPGQQAVGVDHTELIKMRRFEKGIAVINPTTWFHRIELGGAYYDVHSWNGQFYEFSGLRTRLTVCFESGEVLVGTGVVPDYKVDSARAAESGEAVVLTWDPIDGAASYSVYRCQSDGFGGFGEKSLLGVVEEPLYTDWDIVEAGDYRYFIAPIDDLKCEGQQSRAIEVSTEPGSDLSIALIVDELDETLALHWNPVDDLAPPGSAIDLRTAITGVWPLPAAEGTTVSFTVADDERWGDSTRTKLAVYDVAGRLVRRLVENPLEPGRHVRQWDLTNDAGAGVASGCYFFVLERGRERVSSKTLVLR